MENKNEKDGCVFKTKQELTHVYFIAKDNKCGLLYATYLPKTEHHRSIAAQNVAKAFLKLILFCRSLFYIFMSQLTKYLTK